MKRIMILFFIVNTLSFSVVKGNTDNLIIAKNQQEITDEKINQLNARIAALEKEIKYRPVNEKDDGGYIYNIDQIYNNSLRYYEKSSADIKWFLGAIAVLLGFFKWDSDKKLKEEKKDIKDDNREIKKENKELRDKIEEKTLTLSNEFTKKIQNYEKHVKEKIQEETLSLEKKFNKIIEEHEGQINKIKEQINKDKEIIKKDREITEFNRALGTVLNKTNPEEKTEGLKKLENKFSKIENPKIHFEIAYQYDNLNLHQDAILAYNKAIELDPNSKTLYDNRAADYVALNQYDKAVLDYDKVISLNPHDERAYLNRASAYFALEQYQKAILDYDKVIELNPHDEGAYYNRACTYSALKKYPEAISDYDKVIALDHHDQSAYNDRAKVLLRTKKYKLALADLIKCIELDKKFNPIFIFDKEFGFKFNIDISQENYDRFKTYLENLENKNELQEEVFNKLVAKSEGGFTIRAEK